MTGKNTTKPKSLKTGATVNLQKDLPSYDPLGTTGDFKSINEGGKRLLYIINCSHQLLKCDGVFRAHRIISFQRCKKPQIQSALRSPNFPLEDCVLAIQSIPRNVPT